MDKVSFISRLLGPLVELCAVDYGNPSGRLSLRLTRYQLYVIRLVEILSCDVIS